MSDNPDTPATRADIQHLENLIIDLTNSLGEEMRTGFGSVNARLDSQSARLERHAALWQTGRRWSGRMDEWAETVDTLLESRARDIAELREEIRQLKKHPPA